MFNQHEARPFFNTNWELAELKQGEIIDGYERCKFYKSNIMVKTCQLEQGHRVSKEMRPSKLSIFCPSPFSILFYAEMVLLGVIHSLKSFILPIKQTTHQAERTFLQKEN